MKISAISRQLLQATGVSLILGFASGSGAAPKELVVIEDRGGVSAAQYYQHLNVQPSRPRAVDVRPPQIRENEAFALPVRSVSLTPGRVQSRGINAPGLPPMFLVGDDEMSKHWLAVRGDVLRDIGAVGLVVNVESEAGLKAVKQAAGGGLQLHPVSGDDLATRLGIAHYPVLISSDRIEQ